MATADGCHLAIFNLGCRSFVDSQQATHLPPRRGWIGTEVAWNQKKWSRITTIFLKANHPIISFSHFQLSVFNASTGFILMAFQTGNTAAMNPVMMTKSTTSMM